MPPLLVVGPRMLRPECRSVGGSEVKSATLAYLGFLSSHSADRHPTLFLIFLRVIRGDFPFATSGPTPSTSARPPSSSAAAGESTMSAYDRAALARRREKPQLSCHHCRRRK